MRLILSLIMILMPNELVDDCDSVKISECPLHHTGRTSSKHFSCIHF